MKTRIGFSLLVMLLASSGMAGTIAAPYEIGTWRGFRPAAISYTFDDDLPNQYAVAVPMFNAKGFKLTLFTVTTWVPGGNWTPLKNAAAAGHEIASHTVTHPQDLSTVSATQLTNELKNSQATINANVTAEKCVTLAYPYCVPPANESLVSQYYIAARGCSGQLVPATPSDFMNISSFVCGPQGSIQTPQDFNNIANSAAAANKWCVYLIHAIDNDNGYSPLASSTLQASVNYMSTNQDKFWVETFGNVVCYIRERNAASVSETAISDTNITLQVTNALDGSIYNYPVTLRRPLPANWLAAVVTQNGKSVGAQPVVLHSTNYVMFDVVPNGGDVTITRLTQPIMISNVTMTSPANLGFQLNAQLGARYAIYSSTDLKNWSPVQTNELTSGSTNLWLPATNPPQFFRAQWTP